MSKYFCEVEEGEIKSEDDLGGSDKSDFELEELSSSEELLADPTPSDTVGKRTKYSKVIGRGSQLMNQLNERDRASPTSKSNRNIVHQKAQILSPSPVASDVKRKSRPRRRQSQKQFSVSISPETVIGLRRGSRRCSERVLTRGRSGKKVDSTNAKRVDSRKNDPAYDSVPSSLPDKVVPKTSLKRRLMHMITFSTPAVKEETIQRNVQLADQEPVVATKESDLSKPTKKSLRKRPLSKVEKEPGQVKSVSLKETLSDEGKIETVVITEKGLSPHSSKSENIVVKIEPGDKTNTKNTSVTGDEDLAELRKLALESSVLVTNKKPMSGEVTKGASTIVTSEEADDLTELRLLALRSAMIKKHMARKAKAAAIAAASAVTPPTLTEAHAAGAPAVKPVGLDQQPVAHTAHLGPQFPAANVTEASASSFIGVEQRQPCDASWNTNSYQSAENCDIVDMDLGNTSDEDSQNPDSVECIQLGKDIRSASYVPECWTHFPESDQMSQNVNPQNFDSSSYQSNLLIPLTTSMGAPPFPQTIYRTQQVVNRKPVITPAQMFFPTIVRPVSSTRLNKYSERPNLVKLPVTSQHSEQQLSNNSFASNKNIECFADSNNPCYTNSHNISRASALIQIDLQNETPKEVANLCDIKELNMKGSSSSTLDNFPNSIQGQSSYELADSSDTENMDISSMIVVDEVVCTSPEPDTCIDQSSSVPPDTSNVLTDVPVQSSRYTHRSLLLNNSPSTVRKVTMKKPANSIPKLKHLPTNPFILNNVRKTFQETSRIYSFSATKRQVSQAQKGNLNIKVTNESYEVVDKPKQFSSGKNLTVHVPPASSGQKGRFVINLGDDSDSEEELSSLENPEFFLFPKRTVINERALQHSAGVNQPASISSQEDDGFPAHLDAFLKSTRAKYDLKSAMLKEKHNESTVSSKSSSETNTSTSSQQVSRAFANQVPGKDLGTSEVVNSTSTVTPKMSIHLNQKLKRRIPDKPSGSSHPVECKGNPNRKRETIKDSLLVQPGPNSCKETADEEKELSKNVSNISTPLLFSKSSMAPLSAAIQSDNPVPPNAGQKTISLAPVVSSRKATISVAAQPKLSASVTRTPKPRITMDNTHTTGREITSAKTIVQTHGSTLGATSAATVSKNNSAAQSVLATEITKNRKTRITFDNTVPLSGVDQTPKNMIGPRVKEANTTVLKPQASKQICSPALKLVEPSTASPSSEVVPSNNMQSADQDISLDTINKTPGSINDTQVPKPRRRLKRLASNSEPQTPKKMRTAPILESESQNPGLQDRQSVEMNEMDLELAEGRLLAERKSLLQDLTVILDQLNDSSKVEQALAEMKETISLQQKIIELARNNIKLTRERMADESKKRAQTFSFICERRKNVSQNRDLCNKLRDQCVNLGLKIKGKSYVAPQPLEAELRLRLEDVAAGISKTMKSFSPQKKVPSSRASSDDTESMDISLSGLNTVGATTEDNNSSEIFGALETASSQDSQDLPSDAVSWLITNLKSDKNCRPMAWAVECPYEVTGICGDLNDCPFVHTKHR